VKNPYSTLKATTSPILDGTPLTVSTTPHAPIREEVDGDLEGEKNYNSLPFADGLKKA